MARSGHTAVEWDLPLPASVFVRTAQEGLGGKRSGQPGVGIPLAPSLRARCNWKGALLWGAWRGDGEQERFLTLGYRAGDALRGGFVVEAEAGGETQARFHASMAETWSGARISRTQSDALLSRGIRAINRDLQEDFEINWTMGTPYAALLRKCATNPLSLFEAASAPLPEPLEPLPGTSAKGGKRDGGPIPPEELLILLQQERKASAVFAPSATGACDRGHPLRRSA
ncbi:MAG: hypothetical protein IT169_18385 [Bryobacterales bacterium]|nr:hypothetical protein [Bryobacterales bacterium]